MGLDSMRVLGATGADAANALSLARTSDERSRRTEDAVGQLQRDVRDLSTAVASLKARATLLMGVAGVITAATPVVNTWLELSRSERTEAQASIAAERAVEAQREAQERQLEVIARRVVEAERKQGELELLAERRRELRLRDDSMRRGPDVVTTR